MASCYICDGHIEELRLDPRDMKTKPCTTCLDIINDAAGVFDDDDMLPFDDEEFGGSSDDLLLEEGSNYG